MVVSSVLVISLEPGFPIMQAGQRAVARVFIHWLWLCLARTLKQGESDMLTSLSVCAPEGFIEPQRYMQVGSLRVDDVVNGAVLVGCAGVAGDPAGLDRFDWVRVLKVQLAAKVNE
ncbi:hypothetical protein FHR99_003172 [Litorivivens lipolytica]|uniref:Uncharacterized protein n=1 Tax=Litorivivens lipolytica TaxID=1524264 RepID=A0A7W4W8G1_9GAMM|nr:hypothetical protein [Litorivivens lipolytica]MBB3048898.1 hypothetical protein [Litorivivens lipolytica]